MRLKNILIGTFIFILWFFMHKAEADTLVLKNGSEVECNIIKETDKSYIVEVEGGTIEFTKSEVKSIDKRENSVYDTEYSKKQEAGEKDKETEVRAKLPIIKSPCSSLIGEIVAVRGIVEMQNVFVGITEDDLKDAIDTLIAKDTEGLRELVYSGRVFLISKGVEVRILKCDTYKGMVKIRIINGSLAGEAGWAYITMVFGDE